jgi:thiamine-phosphate pyrophosphorylase
MNLPRLLLLTDRAMSEQAGLGLERTLTEAVRGGATAVVVREKDLPQDARTELARRVGMLLQPVGGTVIVASDPAVARAAFTPWLHLASADPVPPSGFRWGRSCHSTDDVVRAAGEGACYVTVSPVYASASKPGYGPPLGIDGLRAMVTVADVPVFALGGIDRDRANLCRSAGAYGVAVMGDIMRAADPAVVVQGLLP